MPNWDELDTYWIWAKGCIAKLREGKPGDKPDSPFAFSLHVTALGGDGRDIARYGYPATPVPVLPRQITPDMLE